MPSMASSKERMHRIASATGFPHMSSTSHAILHVAPAPQTVRSRIPLVGHRLDARHEAAFQSAFDRSEGAVIAALAEHDETVVYAHSFTRSLRPVRRTTSFSVGIPATLGAFGVAAGAAGAPPLLAGASFALALAAAGVGMARAGWSGGSPSLSGARVAAICTLSIIVATPTRTGAHVRRVPLRSIRGVARDADDVVIRLAGEEIVLDGLAHPKRFVGEARRCIDEEERRADAALPTGVATDLERDACEAAAIRRRLRERGWMLAVANDYRLAGEWHVFYSFTHPDGIAAKGEGTSDLIALRLAEADILAKETWLRSFKEVAA